MNPELRLRFCAATSAGTVALSALAILSALSLTGPAFIQGTADAIRPKK